MRHKLLLADDSVTIQRVIELTFADEDIQVLVAGDGRTAIERIQADRPDIVLADVGMPERDGYEVAAFVKSDPQLSSIPVLLLTGAFEPLDDQRARAVGYDGVLVKPFEPQMVINRVKELLARGPSTTTAAPTGAQPGGVEVASAARPAPPDLSPAGIPETGLESLDEPPAEVGASLEDYFDRLDAAFANIGAAPPRHSTRLEHDEVSRVVGDMDPPAQEPPAQAKDPLHSWDPDITGGVAPARQPHLADAFAALLAAEQGYAPPPMPVDPFLPPPPAITDEVIEEVVRRVIARMGEESTRQVVLDAAERLVREEIDRIKRLGKSGTQGSSRHGA
jgi:CheY-like chemotaxis protein